MGFIDLQGMKRRKHDCKQFIVDEKQEDDNINGEKAAERLDMQFKLKLELEIKRSSYRYQRTVRGHH
jgi:hypothetical protein